MVGTLPIHRYRSNPLCPTTTAQSLLYIYLLYLSSLFFPHHYHARTQRFLDILDVCNSIGRLGCLCRSGGSNHSRCHRCHRRYDTGTGRTTAASDDKDISILHCHLGDDTASTTNDRGSTDTAKGTPGEEGTLFQIESVSRSCGIWIIG